MSKPSALGNVIIEAARKAGRSLARDFGEIEYLQVSKKGPADFVSNADHRAEDIIYEHLSKARPGYGFVMEERGIVEGSDKTNRFIVDPLDGTLNFLHGQPHYAVSIALEREGQLFSGVVYDVAKNEIFWAETGRGAWLGQRKLRVAGRKKLEEAVIATAAEFGITGQAEKGATGVWVELGSGQWGSGSGEGHKSKPETVRPIYPTAPTPLPTAKLCAMGVRIRKNTTLHGLALNVTTDLTHFQTIDPCGLGGRPVTSLAQLLGDDCPSMEQVKQALARQLAGAIDARSADAVTPPAENPSS